LILIDDDFLTKLPVGKFLESIEDFNDACEHIVLLLEESEFLYQRNSFSTSVFMSITAIEETAKVNFGLFTSGGDHKRKGNIFYDHHMKHKMGSLQTVAMGTRLQAAIGQEALNEIMAMAHNKDLLKLRENSLYFDKTESGSIQFPRKIVDQKLARNILLYAIEVFDDSAVGHTQFSIEISKRTDLLFSRIAAI
jgi:AbiV family abortive infection protein